MKVIVLICLVLAICYGALRLGEWLGDVCLDTEE